MREMERDRETERRRRKGKKRGTGLLLATDPSYFGPCDLQDP